MSYFAEPHTHSKNKLEVELVLSNYATTSDLKKATVADLTSDVDKLDIDKLKNVPSGLSNLKSKIDKLDI